MADDINEWTQLPVNPNTGRPVLSLSSAPVESPLPVEQPTFAYDPRSLGNAVGLQQPLDKLFGLNGQERYQLWPEKMVRSALSLPVDVMSGNVLAAPGLRREDYTDIPYEPKEEDKTALGKLLDLYPIAAQPLDPLIERSQDVAGLMGGAPLAVKPGVASLGSGMVRIAKDFYGNEITDYHGNPIKLDENGKLTLFHRTNEDAKNQILKTGNFKSKENTNETFFSDNLDSEYGKGFGDHVVAVKVDPRLVRLNDQFPSGENHYAISNKHLTKKNILLSDTSKPSMALSAIENAPVFHSAVENAINTSTLKSATPEQWLGTIANQKGVKPEELEWTGLKDFLADRKDKVTKEELQSYMNAHKIELKEVNKGKYEADKIDDKQYHKDLDRISVRDFGQLYDHIADSEQQIVRQSALERQNQNPTKYSQWQLPGGENYREMLLTLPTVNDRYIKFTDELKQKYGDLPFNKMPLTQYERSHIDNLIGQYGEDGGKFKSSHWDEPNILAHIRMNDRMMGNHKSLHLEEIQSDWHQKGRDEGYKLNDKQKAELERIDEKLMNAKDAEEIMGNPDMGEALKTAVDRKLITQKEAEDYRQFSKGENSSIPDAPFKKSWLELSLKRMIREAAEASHKSEVAHWENMVKSKPDELAHKLVASGHLKEICD